MMCSTEAIRQTGNIPSVFGDGCHMEDGNPLDPAGTHICLFVEETGSAILCGCPGAAIRDRKFLPILGSSSQIPNGRISYARKLLAWVEQEILKKQLKAPFVTLGTADAHPWLKEMYLHLGFRIIGEKQLPGKKHKTIYFQKDVK